MDEGFLSSSNQATKLLHEGGRRSKYRQERCMDNFWFLKPHSAKRKIDFEDEKGSCLRTLQRSKDLQWGVRKKVVYVHRHWPLHLLSAEEVRKKEGSKKRLREEKESGNELGEDVKPGMSEREVDERLNLRVKLEKQFNGVKRKRENACINGETPKEERREPKRNEHGRKCRTEKKGSCRWSPARFENAKNSLVEVIEKMDATWDKPVLRSDLRLEARKCIGDLGLLDHLFKHMVGMVVADGKKRFVKRCNSEGRIEYWLEPANLVHIRCGAGITDDPYWVPPLCWKPGNAESVCICHGHCERMASQLKEEVNLLKRYGNCPFSYL